MPEKEQGMKPLTAADPYAMLQAAKTQPQLVPLCSHCRIQEDVVDEVSDGVLCLCCHKRG